jgi:hypothetical protein
MTHRSARTAEPDRSRYAGVRAFALGVAVTAAVTAAVLASRLLPTGTAGYFALGVGLAFAAGGAALLAHSRLFRRRQNAAGAADPRLQAMRVQAMLGLGFVAKLLGLAAGVGALVAADVKFAGIATFAVTFAAASLSFQLCAAVSMGRTRCDRAPVDDPTT